MKTRTLLTAAMLLLPARSIAAELVHKASDTLQVRESSGGSYGGSVKRIPVPRFDSSLGTLMAVVLEAKYSYKFDAFYNAIGIGGVGTIAPYGNVNSTAMLLSVDGMGGVVDEVPGVAGFNNSLNISSEVRPGNYWAYSENWLGYSVNTNYKSQNATYLFECADCNIYIDQVSDFRFYFEVLNAYASMDHGFDGVLNTEYTLKYVYNSAVPETSAWILFIFGTSMAGAILRRTQKRSLVEI